MKTFATLLFACIISAYCQTLPASCGTIGGTFTQTVYFEEYNSLKVQLYKIAGQIKVVRGANTTTPFITVNSWAENQVDAESVQLGISSKNGEFVVLVGNNLPPPAKGDLDDADDGETSGIPVLKGSVWKSAAAGVFAAVGTQFMYYGGERSIKDYLPAAALVAGAFISGADAQNVSNCVYGEIIVTLPNDLADRYPAEVGLMINAPDYLGEVAYTIGQSRPGASGAYGTCTVAGVTGDCIATTSCGKNPIPGKCPGPANIQCCVDYYGDCAAGGRAGTCIPTSSCGGTTTARLCPGPSNIQCCTTGGSTPPPTSTGYTSPQAGLISSVPMARQTGTYWPLGGQSSAGSRSPICYVDANGSARQSPTSPIASNYGCATRKFLGSRDGGARYHSGIDVYAPSAGTPVVATEAGRVVNTYPFYENVCCVIVQTDSGIVINYGEISCNYVVRVGDRVAAGQRIGTVGHLNCCNPMLHFETYTQGTTANIKSVPGSISSRLRNPTEYLLNLRENGRSA